MGLLLRRAAAPPIVVPSYATDYLQLKSKYMAIQLVKICNTMGLLLQRAAAPPIVVPSYAIDYLQLKSKYIDIQLVKIWIVKLLACYMDLYPGIYYKQGIGRS
jgi:RNase P/RNase MRP subunit p30